MNAITERVQCGAAFLDETRPGWWRVIDLDLLDIASPCKCTLGQLGAWGGIGAAQAVACGFLSYCATVGEHPAAEYAELTAAWRELTEKRRAEAGLMA